MPASSAIVKCLEQAIDKRFRIVPRTPVIIHTDRGTQFSSKKYREFTKRYKKFFILSMSRAARPTDNPVAERLMRTFKEHSINGKTLQEFIFDELELYGEVNSFFFNFLIDKTVTCDAICDNLIKLNYKSNNLKVGER
jgi:putative transposase